MQLKIKSSNITRCQSNDAQRIHTDSYISYGYQAGMHCALDAANMSEKPTIVEGVHGYRMLRSGMCPKDKKPEWITFLNNY